MFCGPILATSSPDTQLRRMAFQFAGSVFALSGMKGRINSRRSPRPPSASTSSSISPLSAASSARSRSSANSSAMASMVRPASSPTPMARYRTGSASHVGRRGMGHFCLQWRARLERPIRALHIGRSMIPTGQLGSPSAPTGAKRTTILRCYPFSISSERALSRELNFGRVKIGSLSSGSGRGGGLPRPERFVS